jgi:hypothetical protein
MPAARCIPALVSISAAVTRTPGRSAYPVILMIPEAAWMVKSIAPSWAKRLSRPYPLPEAKTRRGKRGARSS